MSVFSQVIAKSRVGKAVSGLGCGFVLLGSLSLSPGAFAQDAGKPAPSASQADADKAYTMHRVFKKGDITRNKMKMTMTMHNPQGGDDVNIVMSYLMKESVNHVGDDGSDSISIDYEKATVSVMGMDQDLTSMMPKFTISHDKDGKITTKTEGGSTQAAQAIGDVGDIGKMMENAYPKKPLKIGDTWDNETKVPGRNGAEDTTVKTSVKLVSLDTIDGVKVFKLETKSDSEGGSTLHQLSTIFIEMATGKLVKMTTKGDIEVAGQNMKMDMTMSMVKPTK